MVGGWLLLVSVIMAGVIVGIGAYCQRYRHYPLTRFMFLCATTLFLPIVSTVVSLNDALNTTVIPATINEFWELGPVLMVVCNPTQHSILVISWALLILNLIISTSIVVAVDGRYGKVKVLLWSFFMRGVAFCTLASTTCKRTLRT